MTTRVISTGYGRPALDELTTLVAEVKADDPLTPVTVLVPNQAASVVVRRHLASGVTAGKAGIAGLFLSTIDRLAERLAAPLLSPRRPATRPILAAAWRSALADDPGMFAQIREHQSTVTALLGVHRELRALDQAQLTKVAAGSRLAADVVRLHCCVQRRVEDRFYDEKDLLRGATDHLIDDAGARAELGAIVLYLPENLTVPQQDLVAVLGQLTHLTVIAGRAGLPRADRATLTTLDRLTDIAELPEHTQPTASRVFNASDSDDEVRCVVRELLSDLQSVPAHRVGVLYCHPQPVRPAAARAPEHRRHPPQRRRFAPDGRALDPAGRRPSARCGHPRPSPSRPLRSALSSQDHHRRRLGRSDRRLGADLPAGRCRER